MIKFFRKIRQKLLSNGKTGAYLAYAGGEIILVVIGILIALQINNWNEHKKNVVLATDYISDIKNDLVSDTLTFNSALKRLENTVKNNEVFLDPDKNATMPVDSLFSLLTTSFHSTRIYKIDLTTYQKLSNTGFLNSGIYSGIFTDINIYYNREYTSYVEYIEWDEEQTNDILHSDFIGDFNGEVDYSSLDPAFRHLPDKEDHSEMELSLRAFINTTEFRNKAWANIVRKRIVADRISFQKQVATELIAKIDSVLQD